MKNIFDHILLVGFGGPTNPTEIMPFLETVTKGRNIPVQRLQSVAHHYEEVGGKSPYNEHTIRLLKAVMSELRLQNIDLPVFVGMRNWRPFLKNTLTEIKRRGLKRGIALILAPHRAEASYDRYIQNIEDAKKEAQATDIEYVGVDLWHDHPSFIEAQSLYLKAVIDQISPALLQDNEVVFTAHSIPVEMEGCPEYQKQFIKTCELIAGSLNIQNWSTCFQSRSGNPFQAWLEPDVLDHLKKFKKAGRKSVVLVPVGFLCDNVEVLFDLDIEAKEECKKLGLQYHRASTVMDHPSFVKMWIDLIIKSMNNPNPRSLKVSTTQSEQSARPAMPSSPEALDLREKGAPKAGQPQATDRRMYFQMLCFTGVTSTTKIVSLLKKSKLDSVLYKDLNDPYGIGLLLMSEHPEKFISEGEKIFRSKEFKKLQAKPELTMLGRTYSSGREQDLEDWMLNKYRRNALNTHWPWAVWYPLRRKPEFALLTREEQGKILMEHAMLGQTYGMSNMAYDVRLSCYGIDKHDNEFVIGLVGPELYPLSRLVQDMRKTQQTTKYIQNLGPFFVGHVVWQSTYKDVR